MVGCWGWKIKQSKAKQPNQRPALHQQSENIIFPGNTGFDAVDANQTNPDALSLLLIYMEVDDTQGCSSSPFHRVLLHVSSRFTWSVCVFTLTDAYVRLYVVRSLLCYYCDGGTRCSAVALFCVRSDGSNSNSPSFKVTVLSFLCLLRQFLRLERHFSFGKETEHKDGMADLSSSEFIFLYIYILYSLSKTMRTFPNQSQLDNNKQVTLWVGES